MSPRALEFQPFLATFYALAIYGVLLAASALLVQTKTVAAQVTSGAGRYGGLDGLRGVLAVGVFAHHSFAAYTFFLDGRWDWSRSAVMNHLGGVTVAMFFMITGFLFTLKAHEFTVDWRSLYIGRLARLLPLYVVVVSVVVVTVFCLTGWTMRESPVRVAAEVAAWLGFVVYKRPDINAFPQTWTLVAGVNWSLAYEVYFYVVAVPLIHFASRRLRPNTLLLTCAVLLAGLLAGRWSANLERGPLLHWTNFVCGIFVALMYRRSQMRTMIQDTRFRWTAGASLLLLYSMPMFTDSRVIAVSALAFCAIVGGMSCGGLLRTKAARWLGDVSYGLYLMHGLCLYATLSALRSHGVLAGMSLSLYLFVVSAVGIVCTLLASASYLLLERPAMSWTRRSLLHRGQAQVAA